MDGHGTDEQFRYCTLLQISEDDGLPGKLCLTCTEHMKISYEFRFQATYAENYFRKTIALKKELNEKHDAAENVLNASATVTEAGNDLDENMQEIDMLLVQHEPVDMDLEDNQHYSHLDDSDELSDHFGDAFEAEENNPNANESLQDQKYEAEKKLNIDKTTTAGDSEQVVAPKEVECKDEESPEYSYYYTNSTEPIESTRTARTETISSPSPLVTVTPTNFADVATQILNSTEVDNSRLLKTKTGQKIECNICGSNFTHINSLKQHLMKHTGEKPFKCEYCDKCFARKTILTIHRRLHTGDRPYRCDECIFGFVTKEALNRHKQRTHAEHTTADNYNVNKNKKDSFICEICHKELCSKYSLTAHMRTHHASRQANNSPTTRSSLRKTRTIETFTHKASPSTSTSSSSIKYCKICQQGFANKFELLAHQQAHEITQQFECQVCQRAFEQKYQLLYHLQTHEDADILLRKYTEPTQKKKKKQTASKIKTRSRGPSTTHDDVDDDDNEDEYEEIPWTQRQRKITSTKGAPKMQTRRSKRISQTTAGTAGQVELAKSKSNLAKSATKKITKTKKMPKQSTLSVANASTAAFTVSATNTKCRAPKENLKLLKQNLMCQLCKQTFTHSTSLKVHMMKHTGDRPFKCEHCGKMFGRKSVLNVHRRLHTGDKPHKCPLCEIAFVTKEALLRHMAKTHDKPQFECNICNVELPNALLLYDHQCTTHAVSIKDEKETTTMMITTTTMTTPTSAITMASDLYKCNLCGQLFNAMNDYTNHLNMHEPSVQFQCEICELQFEKKFQLLYHMQKHKIEKETCKKCGEVFTIKEELIKHVKARHLNKLCLDEQCPVCRVGLYDKRDLKKHLYEMHDITMKGLNTCDSCSIDFITPTEYYKHIYACHDVIGKGCHECGCHFKSRKLYDKHVLKHFI